MKRYILFLLTIFSSVAFGQYQSQYTGAQMDSATTAIRIPTIMASMQTINGSVSAGEVVELTDTGWDEADATAESTADGIIGIYIGDNRVLIQGVYTTTSLSAGSLYWLSETEGLYTSTKPTTAGTIVKFVGQAISSTKLLLMNNLWIEN